ncbi:hypothetical protein LJR255_001272 [Pararhizobium sp. LjRoot255]
MPVTETQRKSVRREYRQLMFRQFLMWLFGVSLPVLLVVALWVY